MLAVEIELRGLRMVKVLEIDAFPGQGIDQLEFFSVVLQMAGRALCLRKHEQGVETSFMIQLLFDLFVAAQASCRQSCGRVAFLAAGENGKARGSRVRLRKLPGRRAVERQETDDPE